MQGGGGLLIPGDFVECHMSGAVNQAPSLVASKLVAFEIQTFYFYLVCQNYVTCILPIFIITNFFSNSYTKMGYAGNTEPQFIMPSGLCESNNDLRMPKTKFLKNCSIYNKSFFVKNSNRDKGIRQSWR